MYRTHTCGELRKDDVGKEVKLAGWVNSRRDHGGVIFVDLRDRYGLTQIAFHPEVSQAAIEEGNKLRSEFVIQVTGKVVARPKDMVNPKLDTGEIEVEVAEVTVLSTAKTPPFELDKDNEVHEDARLEFRYLDS